MTYKISMEMTDNQIEGLVNQLPIDKKIRLVRKLERQTRAKRLNNPAQISVRKILRRIDSRKGTRPSTRDILKEIHTYRKEKHA